MNNMRRHLTFHGLGVGNQTSWIFQISRNVYTWVRVDSWGLQLSYEKKLQQRYCEMISDSFMKMECHDWAAWFSIIFMSRDSWYRFFKHDVNKDLCYYIYSNMEAHNRLANEAASYGGGSYGGGVPQIASASIGLGPGGGFQSGLISPVSPLHFCRISYKWNFVKYFRERYRHYFFLYRLSLIGCARTRVQIRWRASCTRWE